MSTFAVTLKPYLIDGVIKYTNFEPTSKNGFGMPKPGKKESGISSKRVKDTDSIFKAYMDNGLLVGDVKTITNELKSRDAKIFTSKFDCKHTCSADTEDKRSYGIDWRGLNPENDYVFACDKHCNTNNKGGCKTLMFSSHSTCPFTRFDKVISLEVPWTNPILFNSSGSESNMKIAISNHTDTTWYRFWRAVSLDNWNEHAVIEADRIKIKNSFARLRYVFAINAVLNHVSKDNKEVDCEVNMYIRLNGEKFRKAAKFLQRHDNEWREKGITADHFDRVCTPGIKSDIIQRLLDDEDKVLTLATSGTTSLETIMNIYQLYGLTTTASRNVHDFRSNLKSKGRPIQNHMYSMGEYPSSDRAQFDTQQKHLHEEQLSNSLITVPYSSYVDPEINSAADVLLSMRHRN